VTSLTYDPANPGDVISVKDPNGNSYQFGHDGYGNVVKATDPLQNVSTFSYDAVSRLSNSVSPKGNVTGGNPAAYQTSYTYDAFGDVLTLTDPLGHTTRYQYDADRNLTAVTDANGHTTRYAYDADNEPLAGTRADGSQVQNGYNAAGLLASQTDALGHVTTYVYNALERLVSVTDPLNRVTSEGYDPAGNLTSLVDAMGRTTTYSYDGTNELTAVVYSDGKTPNVSYAYDADGRRTSMADGTGTTTYAYDNADRLTQSVNGAGARVGYGYDLNGNLTALTYPGGSQVTQSFNADSELASVSDWLGNTTTFGYDPNGNLTSEIYPNTVQATRAYNAADQLTQIAYSGPLGQISLTEGRDNLGQQTSETVAGAPPNGPISYGYDEVNRLTSANYGASIPQLSYQYDAADRLTQVTSVSSSSTIVSTLAYDPADELISLTKTLAGVQVQKLQYSYDADGNRTQRTDQTGATTTYTYDQANRLTNFNGIAQYSYNGDGLRMGKTVKSAAEAFTWNVASQLPLLIQDGATRYVTGPGGLPLEQIASDGTVRYYLQDALGSTRALTNAKGLLDTAYLYDPYGNLLYVSGSTTPNPFQFAGQYTDSESGLQYLQARYYDATTAQFITSDPRLLKIGHTYTYVSDTPLNGTDPTGRLSLRDIQSAWGVLSSNAGLISDFTGGLALITAVDVPVSVTLSAISTGFGVIDAINKCQGGQLFTFGCGFAVAGALLGAAGIAFKTLQLLIGLPAKLAALGAGALADAAIEAIGFKRLVRFVNTANYLAALSWPDWLAGAFTALDELLYGWKNRAAFLSNPPGASQSAALPIDSSPTKAGGC
jgi:RHS repeat-associated protein